MKQYFTIPITDIIRNRHSVRTYASEVLDKELIIKLKEYANKIKGPFASELRLELVDSLDFSEKTGNKIGTYGVIKGAKTYIAGVTDKKEYNMEQLGYCLEKLILYAASLGLGTCWMAGTFKRSQFAELVGLREDEFIPAVTPIGYHADKRAFVDSMMRRMAGSDNRKPWSELFFHDSFDTSLNSEAAGNYKVVLEMLRLAPSASNKQPWRVLKQGSEYHFYLKQAKGYGSALGFNIQKIDMGIAMCHFEMTAFEAELKGNWMVKTQSPLLGQEQNLEYIVSWIMK
ncbi:MAG: nitroreductase [Clostridiales bacterium GWB2_37_7]|nr:MAG: nitroreductase [Clostridiales bacterium GWB2_37_7]